MYTIRLRDKAACLPLANCTTAMLEKIFKVRIRIWTDADSRVAQNETDILYVCIFSLGEDEALPSLASKGEVLFVRFCDRFLSLCLHRSNGAQSKTNTRCSFTEHTKCERDVKL